MNVSALFPFAAAVFFLGTAQAQEMAMHPMTTHPPSLEVLRQLAKQRGVADPSSVVTSAAMTMPMGGGGGAVGAAYPFAAKRDPHVVVVKNLPPPSAVQVEHNFIDLSRDNIGPH